MRVFCLSNITVTVEDGIYRIFQPIDHTKGTKVAKPLKQPEDILYLCDRSDLCVSSVTRVIAAYLRTGRLAHLRDFQTPLGFEAHGRELGQQESFACIHVSHG